MRTLRRLTRSARSSKHNAKRIGNGRGRQTGNRDRFQGKCEMRSLRKLLMPEGGLEPPQYEVPADFESAAYANFATPASSAINSLPKLIPNPMNLSPICRLWPHAAAAVPPSPPGAPPEYSGSRDLQRSART